ncbi:MAG: carotenoid 1,2-hydratase, partial [Acidiferrobacterales bacterium]
MSMRQRYVWLILALAALSAGVMIFAHDARKRTRLPAPDLGAVLGTSTASGYARADRPRTFRFPHDFGPHRAFKTEWWYFTGNLDSTHGRR